MLDNRDDSSAFSYPVSAQQRWATITERLAERVRESIPAVVAWAVVLAPLWLTYLNPIAGLLLVGSAMAFFIVRSTSFGIMGLVNRDRVLRGLNQDWLAKIYAEKIPWQQYRVTFMIRAFREGNRAMLRQTLEAIYHANWPHDGARIYQVEVVFATEEDDPITPPIVEELAAEYRGRMVVRQVIHPCEPDVLPGPSSAMHYVGRVLRQEAIRQRIDPRYWLIADLDADTILPPCHGPPPRSPRLPAGRPVHHGLLEGAAAQPALRGRPLGDDAGLEPVAGAGVHRSGRQPGPASQRGLLANELTQPGFRHRPALSHAVRFVLRRVRPARHCLGLPGDGTGAGAHPAAAHQALLDQLPCPLPPERPLARGPA
ncbi:MAG: hypothetical protein C4289_11240 [Chloroflexota bacterium]